uniref:Retrovirus-related Pol polyprotein from transposon TNT 1-94-like beta-barrel domain-containing protein n=1 Tax=Vitis vinifera TaxID=29760 RepID=A5C7Y7_VITVI|nr:hypothetical protein VITISV_009201 [Vitis vinifera]
METYLEALDLWETVKEDYDILALLNNPTMAQIKAYKEKKMKKSKAQEQRRLMRQNVITKGALQARHHRAEKNKKKKKKGQEENNDFTTSSNNKSRNGNFKGKYLPCQYYGKKGHPPFRCWRRPDAKYSKCNKLGHEVVICKHKNKIQEADAQALFKDLKPTTIRNVRIGNGDHIPVKENGTIAISTNISTNTISDVLFIPDIDQNSLSVDQLIEKGFKVSFENKHCLIHDANGQEVFKVKMRYKSFSFDPIEEKQVAYSTEENVTQKWHKRLGHCHL